MEKLIKIRSSAIPLPIEDIDTDQIIPARFLKATTKQGFGENLFRDWRYDNTDQKKESFVLNNPDYSGTILVAGKNFGCGSSREHAAWALYDYGFRVVISSFFADIFKANALNNGILPIVLTPEQLHKIFLQIEQDKESSFEVNLEKQVLNFGSESYQFEIDLYKKNCLLNGYDDIDYLLNLNEEIVAFEQKQLIY